MGRPATLTAPQVQRLQDLTRDAPTVQMLRVGRDGNARLNLPMRDHDVVLIELDPR